MNVADTVSKFFDSYPTQQFSKGDVLIQADTQPKAVYYIVSGQVVQYDVLPSGDRAVVNVFKAPAFFPMNLAISGAPSPYICEAFTDLTVRKAPSADVVDFLKANNDVLFDLLSRVYSGTDGLQRRMVYLMGNDARRRLLLELVISAERFGERRKGGVFIAVHEGELATRVGLARETASRALKSLKADGILRVTKDGMEVADLDAVRSQLVT